MVMNIRFHLLAYIVGIVLKEKHRCDRSNAKSKNKGVQQRRLIRSGLLANSFSAFSIASTLNPAAAFRQLLH